MVFLFFVLAACWNIKKVEEKELIQIDLITGFLGSGKTTFLKEYVGYLLSQGEKVGIIENDFGAINIDMLILQDLVGENCELEQIVGGSVVTDWKRRFKAKLISMAMCGYTRILVEPSGIFDVDAFFDMLYDEPLDRWYTVGNIFAIVDAKLEKDLSRQAQYLLTSQIAKAGAIVLSRVQEATKEEMEATKKYIGETLRSFHCDREINDAFYTKRWDELGEKDWEKLKMVGWKRADHEKLWFEHKDAFQSLFILDKHFSQEHLVDIVKKIFASDAYGNVFRVKGFVNVSGTSEPEWIELNATREKVSIEHHEKGQDVIILIGENMNETLILQAFEQES